MNGRTKQRGAALVIFVVILAIVLVATFVAAAPGAGTATEQERQTVRALSIAREALIAYAVSVQPDSSAKRPGDLPCPDLDNDGDAEPTCSLPGQRIGRLPVETLELQDLADGHGERLWYALSGTFDRSTVNQCPTPGDPTTISPPTTYSNCLNSETGGTITVRSPTGAIVNDATSIPGAAVAVIFSAGPTLTRQGAASAQDRGCTGDANVAACQSIGVCSDKLGTTALCNPVNYLDTVSGGGLPSEDNKDFTDNSTTDGFIQGPIRDANGDVIVNDVLLVLRHADVMPRVEQRVAREALRCLQDYADDLGNYPWAAPIASDYTITLADQSGALFGRLPNSMPASTGAWRATCPLDMAASGHEWWANWTNLVFYAVASDSAPGGTPMCGTCLTVTPGGASPPVVVLLAGAALPTLAPPQLRGVGALASNYLEDGNEAGAGSFQRASASSTFNDLVLF